MQFSHFSNIPQNSAIREIARPKSKEKKNKRYNTKQNNKEKKKATVWLGARDIMT